MNKDHQNQTSVNDLPESITSDLRLFADDVYLLISS